MVTLSVGSVVLVPFPFSDLSATKLRPALVVASSGRGDWICAQITSKPYSDSSAIEIVNEDFQVGSLSRNSYIKPAKLFTANQSLFRRNVGKITQRKLHEVHTSIIALFKRNE